MSSVYDEGRLYAAPWHTPARQAAQQAATESKADCNQSLQNKKRGNLAAETWLQQVTGDNLTETQCSHWVQVFIMADAAMNGIT